jgi:hypothetical protein
MDELREWLVGNGFKIYANNDKDNLCDWYAGRRAETDKECGCNDHPPQIIVKPYIIAMNDGNRYKSVEVELVGEDYGLWWNFSVYSLSPKELMENLGMIEERLVKAWELK